MKKLLTLLVLALGLVGMAAAQHHRGGYNNYGGQRHHGGVSFGQALAGAVILTGVAVAANSILRPQPVVVVEEMVQQPQPCQLVWQRVTDPRGRPLYDQYTGQPLVRQVQVCPASVPMVRY